MKALPNQKLLRLFVVLLFSFLSLHAAPTYSCSGEVVPNIDGASAPETWSTTENTTGSANNRARYFVFTPATDGHVSVAFHQDAYSSSNQRDQRLQIGTSCGGTNIHSGSTLKKDSASFSVTAGTTYYVRIQEQNNNSNRLRFTINFTFSLVPVNEGQRDFTLREARNTKGDLRVIGNTVLCVKNSTGACYNYTGSDSNAGLDLKYIDVDSESDTFNSSQAQINIPDTAKIVWAGIYAQGYLKGKTLAQSQTITQEPIFLTVPSMSRFSISPSVIDIYPNGTNGYTYSTFSPVSELLDKTGSEINGWATAANIKAYEGTDSSGLGNFGAWTLVLVYEDLNAPFKNISVFDGYRRVANATGFSSVDIPVSGFVTPTDGAIISTLSIFAGEGDKNIGGDKLYFDGYAINATNAFDSSISGVTRNPSYTNNQGIDIQNHQVGSYLTNKQQSATITLTSTQDTYFPSMVAFTTELYVPKFCYDYAYKQQARYFTEDNFGDKNPEVAGTVASGIPVDVKIFIRNLVASDIDINSVVVNILDINTTQATYIPNSTKLAKMGDLEPVSLSDSILDTSTAYIKDIPIGGITTNDYFTIYYQVDPKMTTLKFPLHVEMVYDITIDGTTLENYSTTLGVGIPMCTTNNFSYAPAKSIFNVVHNDYYNYELGGSNRYYNLPTQVTKREGNFKVIALDPENLDVPHKVSTVVAVEMIDASAYHDTNASCLEIDSAVTERVWIEFNDQKSVMFNKAALQAALGLNNATTSEDFYGVATQNAAFRISYNAIGDTGEDLVKTEHLADGNIKILNFPYLAGDPCKRPVVYPTGASGNTGIATQVSQACGNAGNQGISPEHLQACMECVYGYNIKFICSQDNFAIRPEAFQLQLNDQLQSNPASKSVLNNISGNNLAAGGVIGASITNLAADYNYNLQVVATTHIDNSPSLQYQQDLSDIGDDRSHYVWEPRSTITAGACNDEVNKITPVSFVDGFTDVNTSVSQVGEYRLTMLDTSWTSVDHNPAFMGHHTAPFFLLAPDCQEDISDTFPVNTAINLDSLDTLNGCNISSQHTSTSYRPFDPGILTTIEYIDYDVTFHPYRFDVASITPTVGLDNDPVGLNSFVYMNNIAVVNDENMSVHLNGSILARGFNGSGLSNFVDGCFAKNLDLNVSVTPTDLPVDYQYRFQTLMSDDSVLRETAVVTDSNLTNPIGIFTTDFAKDLNGEMKTILNLNFTREVNATINPEQRTFSDYDVNCTNPTTDCRFNADLTIKTTTGTKDLDAIVKHYYGRTFTNKQRYPGQTGNAFVNYEVFCDAGCTTPLLQSTNISLGGDPKWFINPNHTEGFGGRNAAVDQKVGNRVVGTPTSGNHSDSTDLVYDGSRGFPYATTMQHKPQTWLIYNRHDNTATSNEFQVEFLGGADGSWAGKHETNSSTQIDAAPATNRRIMW